MQTTGHIVIEGRKYLLLVRQKRYSRLLKLRRGGKAGHRLEDEEQFLVESPALLRRLLAAGVIEL